MCVLKLCHKDINNYSFEFCCHGCCPWQHNSYHGGNRTQTNPGSLILDWWKDSSSHQPCPHKTRGCWIGLKACEHEKAHTSMWHPTCDSSLVKWTSWTLVAITVASLSSLYCNFVVTFNPHSLMMATWNIPNDIVSRIVGDCNDKLWLGSNLDVFWQERRALYIHNII